MLIILEAIGIVGFAFAGACQARDGRLDVFGVIVSATITAIGGGVMRDVLLGVHPPVGLLTGWYFVASIVTALVVFFCYSRVAGARLTAQFADAVGLAMFAVTGASKSLAHGVPWYAAAMIGMVNSIGGGMVVETMLRRTPTVLRRDIYALPALGGGLLVVAGATARVPETPMALIVVAMVVAVRMLAVRRNWNLPVSKAPAATLYAPPRMLVPEMGTERTVELPRLPTALPPRSGWDGRPFGHSDEILTRRLVRPLPRPSNAVRGIPPGGRHPGVR